MIVVSLNSSLLLTYEFPEWLGNLLVVVPFMAQFIALAMFQVTAIQFGTDQLQGASSEQLSMFIFWYFNMELLPRMGLQWVLYLLSYFMINIAQFQLGCSLFCMLLLSVMLCMKSCFMYNWFSGELKKTTCLLYTSDAADE